MKLKKYRELANKSIVSAAAACGVSVRMIYNYESGVSVPSYLTVLTLANFYGVDVYKLADVDRSPSHSLPYMASLLTAASKVSPMALTNSKTDYDTLTRIRANIAYCLADLNLLVENMESSDFIYPGADDLYKELIDVCK